MPTLRRKKRAPTHPGALLRKVVLPELGITQGEFAARQSVSRRSVSEILHERRPLTPDMAIRLGRLMGNGAGLWLRMQQAVDLWALEKEGDYAHIQQLRAAQNFRERLRHRATQIRPAAWRSPTRPPYRN